MTIDFILYLLYTMSKGVIKIGSIIFVLIGIIALGIANVMGKKNEKENINNIINSNNALTMSRWNSIQKGKVPGYSPSHYELLNFNGRYVIRKKF